MLNIRDVRIDPASLGKVMLLVEVKPVQEFKDHKPTGVVLGYKYVVCLPEHRLERLAVKIDGDQRLDDPTDGAVQVRFTGLEVAAYQDKDRQVLFTARATDIALVE